MAFMHAIPQASHFFLYSMIRGRARSRLKRVGQQTPLERQTNE